MVWNFWNAQQLTNAYLTINSFFMKLKPDLNLSSEPTADDLTSSQTTANVIGCTVDIKEVLLTFPTTGICQVDIEKCVQIWNNSFWNISQWKDEYNLVKVYDSDNYGRCKISKQQAHELIGRLNLIDEKSPIFNSGRTWRQVV